MSDTCKERVTHDSWHYHECGKPAKGLNKKGDPACGIHLAAERKREQGYRRSEAKFKRNEELGEEAKRLSSILGVPVHAEWDFRTGACTGMMAVPLEWLQKLIPGNPPESTL